MKHHALCLLLLGNLLFSALYAMERSLSDNSAMPPSLVKTIDAPELESWDDEGFVPPPIVKTEQPAKEVQLAKKIPLSPAKKGPQLVNAGAGQTKSYPRQLLEKAQDLRHKEGVPVEEARIVFHNAMKWSKSPFVHAKAYQGLAKTYAASDTKEALKKLDEAIKLSPDTPDYYFTAGDRAGFSLRDIPRALDYFRKGYQKCRGLNEHKKTMYFNSVGALYYDIANDPQKALEFYEMGLEYCLKSYPKEAGKFYRLVGSTCLELGVREKAPRKLLNKSRQNLENAVTRLDFTNYDETLITYASLGKTLNAAGNYEDAEQIFETGLAYLKEHTRSRDRTQLPIFYDVYASFRYSRSQKGHAQQLLEEGIAACKDVYAYETSQLYRHYGFLLKEADKLDDALRAYEQGFEHAQAKKPYYAIDLAFDIAHIWKLQGNSEKADEYQAKAIELIHKIAPDRKDEIVAIS